MTQSFKRLRPSSRAIITVDLDCFYASVAIRARPHLKDKPVVIVQKHLCVTSNYVARQRAHGAVQKMTPVSKALRACPDLVQIDGSDLTPFREANAEIMSIVRSFLKSRVSTLCDKLGKQPFEPPIQRQGLDEVFIDVTELVAAEILAGGRPWHFAGHLFGSTEDDDHRRTLMVASQLAAELREKITTATQLTLCAGVSDRKLLAKLAVNMNKPDDQTTFLPGNVREYIAGITPRHLQGIGYAIDGKIQAWVKQEPERPEISTAGDIVRCFGIGREGLRKLSAIVGTEAIAKTVLALCTGQDDSPVLESGDAPKSMASMGSFRNCSTMDNVRHRAKERATDLVTRLRRDAQLFRRRPRTLTVGFRFKGGGYTGTMRAATMPIEVVSLCSSKGDSAVEPAIAAIQAATLRVLKEHGNVTPSSKFDLTLITISATNFTDATRSTTLLEGSKKTNSPGDISCFFKKSTSTSSIPESLKGVNKSMLKPEKRFSGRETMSKVVSKCPICACLLPSSIVQASHHVDICLRRGNGANSGKTKKTVSNTRRVDSFFRKQ